MRMRAALEERFKAEYGVIIPREILAGVGDQVVRDVIAKAGPPSSQERRDAMGQMRIQVQELGVLLGKMGR